MVVCWIESQSERSFPRETLIAPLLALFATQVMNPLFTISKTIDLLNPSVLKIKHTLITCLDGGGVEGSIVEGGKVKLPYLDVF